MLRRAYECTRSLPDWRVGGPASANWPLEIPATTNCPCECECLQDEGTPCPARPGAAVRREVSNGGQDGKSCAEQSHFHQEGQTFLFAHQEKKLNLRAAANRADMTVSTE